MQKALSFIFIFLISFSVNADEVVKNPFVYLSGQRVPYNDLTTLNKGCPYDIITPYKGDLLIESKYDQTDKTKSTLKKVMDKDSKKKKQAIHNFTKTIVKYSDYAVKNTSKKKQSKAIKCINENLLAWSKDSVLIEVETTKTGKAVRKWFLASIASSLMKLDAKYPNYVLNKEIELWLGQLALKVYEDYKPRIENKSVHINNHDYWAAWALASVSVLNNDIKLLNWSENIFHYAMSQVQTIDHKSDGNDKFSYLPNEIKRNRLAADYSNYALVPLMFIADVLLVNDKKINEDLPKLKSLANFAANASIGSKKLSSLLVDKQKEVSAGKLIWLLPYIKIFGQDNLTKTMLEEEMLYTNYGQMGGNLKPFYLNKKKE